MSDVRVLVVDDHPLFRSGLRALLGAVDGMTLVGEAASGGEAVELAGRLRPDVVLMDLQMPDLSGIEATRRVVAADPGAAVLVVTMHEDDASVFAAMRAGARGYVLKDTDEELVLDAIRAVARCEAIFSPAVARRVLAFFSGRAPHAPTLAFPELTAREREVLDLIAQGLSNPEITARLVLSPKTVRTTSRRSSPNCRWPTARRRSCVPGRPGWADQPGGQPRPRPPRTCRWMWSTDCPAFGPVLVTTR